MDRMSEVTPSFDKLRAGVIKKQGATPGFCALIIDLEGA